MWLPLGSRSFINEKSAALGSDSLAALSGSSDTGGPRPAISTANRNCGHGEPKLRPRHPAPIGQLVLLPVQQAGADFGALAETQQSRPLAASTNFVIVRHGGLDGLVQPRTAACGVISG